MHFPARIPATGRTAVVPFATSRILGAECFKRKLVPCDRFAGCRRSLPCGGRETRQNKDRNISADCACAGGRRPVHLASVAQAASDGNPSGTRSFSVRNPPLRNSLGRGVNRAVTRSARFGGGKFSQLQSLDIPQNAKGISIPLSRGRPPHAVEAAFRPSAACAAASRAIGMRKGEQEM